MNRRRCFAYLCGFLAFSSLAYADTVNRVDSDGKEILIEDGVIVTKIYNKDEYKVDYYLCENGLIHSTMHQANRKRVKFSNKEQRQKILSRWKSEGIHAMITDLRGKRKEYFCFTAYYGPYKGYTGWFHPEYDKAIWIESSKNSSPEKYDFYQLSSIKFHQGTITIKSKYGLESQGKLSAPLMDGKYRTAHYSVIDEEGKLIELEIDEISLIEFIFNNNGQN